MIDRFKEPSTYASIAAALVGFGVYIPEPFIAGGSLLLAGIASILGIFLKEGK